MTKPPENKGLPSEGASTSGARPSIPADEMIDGRYRVEARLGAGTMGVVYRAEDVFLRRTVAIKVVDAAYNGDPATLERFLKEARALAQIRHDNVVQVYAFGPHRRSYYFAMEYVAGRNLDDVVEEYTARGETMELPQVFSIVRQIARGLSAVHERKLVHRDVKPGNIVLEARTGRPVLVDFGLARRRTSSNPKMSIIAGTPSYMAPEQSRDVDGSRVTSRADIYAFACTAFELLTGSPVFRGKDVYEVLLAHLKEQPPKVSFLKPELAAFDAVIARALSKEAADRYESCEAFLVDFDAAAKRVERASRPSFDGKSSRRLGRMAKMIVCAEDAAARPIERQFEKTLREIDVLPVAERVASADAALAACAAEDVRVAVLDEDVLGARASEEIARQLLGMARKSSLHIIVLTRDFQTSRPRLTALGALEVMAKPLNAHVLESVFTRVVERSGLRTAAAAT